MAHSAQKQPNDDAMTWAAKRLALEMGTEDDSGFWELLWDMRHTFPGVDDDELVAKSQEAMSELIKQRLVQVIWWDPKPNLEFPVTHGNARELINEDAHWHEPEGWKPRHLRFFATPAGERAYHDGVVTAK